MKTKTIKWMLSTTVMAGFTALMFSACQKQIDADLSVDENDPARLAEAILKDPAQLAAESLLMEKDMDDFTLSMKDLQELDGLQNINGLFNGRNSSSAVDSFPPPRRDTSGIYKCVTFTKDSIKIDSVYRHFWRAKVDTACVKAHIKAKMDSCKMKHDSLKQSTNYRYVNAFARGRRMNGSRDVKYDSVTRTYTTTVNDTIKTAKGDLIVSMLKKATQTEGFNTKDDRSDDVFKVEITSTTTMPDGKKSSVKTIEPLIFKGDCRWVVKGKIAVEKDGKKSEVDFGDGTCDNKATVKDDQGTKEIKLR